MKSVIIISTIAIVALFSFQNCGKTNSFHSELAGRDINLSLGVEKTNVLDLNIGATQFYLSDSKVVTQAGHTYQLNFKKILEINLDSGYLVESTDIDSTSKQFCLPQNILTDLMTLLNSAQICREKLNLPADTVCALVYTEPYAKLLSDREDINLGVASDSCGNNKTDLCGQTKVQLLDLIKTINQNYSAYNCL